MQDFNLRPEIMGFGRSERALQAEKAPAPAPPAEVWKPHGKDFEVNGLGRLRTALALPASEFEIAASMRHADAPPIPRRGRSEQAAFDDWVHGTYPSGDAESVQYQWASSSARAEWAEENDPRPSTQTNVQADGRPGRACAAGLSRQSLNAYCECADCKRVRGEGRNARIPPLAVTPELCHCDSCVASRKGRFQPQPSDDPRPLIDQMKSRHPELTTSQAAAETVGEASFEDLQTLLMELVRREGHAHAQSVLREFAVERLGKVPSACYAKLRARIQSDLDVPF